MHTKVKGESKYKTSNCKSRKLRFACETARAILIVRELNLSGTFEKITRIAF